MLLLLSFLALALGPLLVWLARSHAWSTVSLDSFCLLTISGFALLHLLPESAAQAGWLVLPLALVGFVLPSIAERTLHQSGEGVRRTVIALAVLGIAAHATLDGLFLHGDHLLATGDAGHGHAHSHELTAWAIILHRIPEGIGIWWIVPRTLGVLPAVLVTLVSIAATSFGFLVGEHALTDTSQRGLAMLQSLLVGSLLHVVLHSHIPAPREQGRFRFASVGGALLGIGVLWFVIHDHFPHDGDHDHGGPGAVFLHLAMESAPALLLAYLLVGLCHAFLPAHWLASVTRGPKVLQALRGVAVGLPLPVCSCGVVPIYRELIRQGAALAAGLAFLVATPELELAAVLLTWQLMGGEVALVRVGMAAVLALGVGVLVASFAPAQPRGEAATAGHLPEDLGGSVGNRIGAALRFGFGPAVDNTATWILTGLMLSALLMPYVDHEQIAALPAGIDVPIAALVGLPLYVCATGSTPLAAMLLAQGMSPGAVLALLLTGPATNVTTFGVLARLHGKRVAATFAVAMWVGAVLLGYLANWLLADVSPVAIAEPHRPDVAGWLWLAALAAVMFWSLLRQGVRPFLERLFESPANLGHGGHHGHDHGGGGGCCSHGDAAEAPGTADHSPTDHAHAHHAAGHEHAHHDADRAAPPSGNPPAPRPAAKSHGGHDCCGH